MINDLQEFDTEKNLLAIAINFICSKYAEEERFMHSKSNNINLMMQIKSLMNSLSHFM